MSYSSPATKKRRRSSFIERRLLINGNPDIVDESPVSPAHRGVVSYVERVKNEEKAWENSEKALCTQYHKLKRGELKEIPLNNFNYLDYLSHEDRCFIELLNEKEELYINCHNNLPKLNESIRLLTYELNNQLKMLNEVYINCKKHFSKIEAAVCDYEKEEDINSLLKEVLSFNSNDSKVYDEPYLYVDSV